MPEQSGARPQAGIAVPVLGFLFLQGEEMSTATETIVNTMSIKKYLDQYNIDPVAFLCDYRCSNAVETDRRKIVIEFLTSGDLEFFVEAATKPVEIFAEPQKLRVYDYRLHSKAFDTADHKERDTCDFWVNVWPQIHTTYSNKPRFFKAVAKWGEYYFDARGRMANRM
jgi:hypothetical protein